jgi:ribosomal protein S18
MAKERRREEDNVNQRPRFRSGPSKVDISDMSVLERYVTEQGKIVPSRLTGVSSKQQRQIRRAVKRVRSRVSSR